MAVTEPSVSAHPASDSAAPTRAWARPATSRSPSSGSSWASRAAAAISSVTKATRSARIVATSRAKGSPLVRAWLCSTAQPSGCSAVCVKKAPSPSQSWRSGGVAGSTPWRTARTSAAASRRMQAVKRSSLEFRYRYTKGLDTPASSAMPSMEAAR